MHFEIIFVKGKGSMSIIIYLFYFFLVFLPFLGLLPMACVGSQARGPIGAVATGLQQSHSNAGSKLHLRPTAQLTAMPDPSPTD